MKIKKTLEKPTLIAGVEMGDLFLLLLFGFSSVILLSMLRIFMPIPSWVNIVLLSVLIIGFVGLRKLTKKHRAGYLKSLIFWHLNAPKKVLMKQPKILREFQAK